MDNGDHNETRKIFVTKLQYTVSLMPDACCLYANSLFTWNRRSVGKVGSIIDSYSAQKAKIIGN